MTYASLKYRAWIFHNEVSVTESTGRITWSFDATGELGIGANYFWCLRFALENSWPFPCSSKEIDPIRCCPFTIVQLLFSGLPQRRCLYRQHYFEVRMKSRIRKSQLYQLQVYVIYHIDHMNLISLIRAWIWTSENCSFKSALDAPLPYQDCTLLMEHIYLHL